MTNYKTIKFNDNLYPYVIVTYYDYGRNTELTIKVGTNDLLDDLLKALDSSDKALKEKAKNFDPEFKRFIPRNLLIKQGEAEIIKYLETHEE